MTTKTFSNISKLILGAILLLGAFFRLYGLNWDSGFHLHHDERMLVMVTERIHLPKDMNEILSPESPLNPKFFPYGSFPIYLLRLAANLTAQISHNSLFANYALMNLVGRIISATFDLATVVLIFKLGRKIFSPTIGLLAGVFYSFCTFPIQLSHFFATDTFLTFFITLTLYRLIIFYEIPSLKNALISGVIFGFALATKVSATVLIASVGTAIAMDLFLVVGRRIRLFLKHKKVFYSTEKRIIIIKNKFNALVKFIWTNVGYFLVITFITMVIFIVLEPYALIDSQTFWQQTREQQAMTKNAYVFPYTLQYVGTTPYLYQIKNFILWGAGIPLGTVSVISILYLIFYLIKEFPKPGNEEQEAKMLILLSFFLVYLLVVGRFAVKFMRYFLPLYPIFFLFASWFLLTIINKFRLLKKALIFFVLLMSVCWSIAFLSIYSKPNTRVTASKWINQNIPPGSYLALEHWDDTLPLLGGEKYHFLEMPLYENDNSFWKWEKVNANLQKADYIILASNRLYVPLQKLADCQKYKVCYPKTAQYYQDLFSGKLGFKKVAEFISYPQFKITSRYAANFKFQIVDDSADESFTVYDHPKIIIFKKNE